MKKILSITIALLMLLSLVSCSGGTDKETTSHEADEATVPVISLVSEKTTVTPGEEIIVKLRIKDAPLTACFDIYAFADDALSYVEVTTSPSELILAANGEITDEEEFVTVRGMVAATYDVLDDDICEIKYIVKEDVPAGTKINLTLQVPTYKLGLDVSGNDIYSVEPELQGLVLEVQ